jgi:hypothetical protein
MRPFSGCRFVNGPWSATRVERADSLADVSNVFSNVLEIDRILGRVLMFHQTVPPSNLGLPERNQAEKADFASQEKKNS